LESDQNRIKQVLVNFVGNSIKFTAKGYVEIGFAIVEGFIQFHVRDTGIGIAKNFHKSVFERFRQVDSSSTRKYGGNGLGLAISKSLVELFGGRIWMESEPDKGSVFYFTIPVQTPEIT
jgi:signal transduction histidine kinase